jgi:hypothetical protein
MYARPCPIAVVTATGDAAKAIAKVVFKRPPNGKNWKGNPWWGDPTFEQCMAIATNSTLTTRLLRGKCFESRYEVIKGSSFYLSE